MDEPLTVIDPDLKFRLRRNLKEINEKYKTTLVYVTHDQNEAMTFADNIIVMSEGRLFRLEHQRIFLKDQIPLLLDILLAHLL